MPKIIIQLILIVINVKATYACLSASQNRIFPLGMTSKGLLVVEAHLYRTELNSGKKDTIELEPAWGGVSYLKIYDNNFKVTHSEILDTIKLFEETNYESIIGRTFGKGMSKARKYPDFVPAKPESIRFCDYRESCSKASLVYDTTNNLSYIKLPNKNTYPIDVLKDTSSIASNVLNYLGSFTDGELSAKGLKGSLYINSIRQFDIGGKTIVIVHIGCGQSFESIDGKTYPPGKEYKAKFNFDNINHSIFEEPVLHHGHGFDFVILK